MDKGNVIEIEGSAGGAGNGPDTRRSAEHGNGSGGVGFAGRGDLVRLPTQAMAETAALVSMVERAARDPNVDIEKFERLMAMRERVEEREARRAYNEAIARARIDIRPILKNRVVDFTSEKGRTHYRHEDLGEIARTIDPVLAANGLSYYFRAAQEKGHITVTCVIVHAAGHETEASLTGGEDHSGKKNALQAVGSAITHLQRYTLKMALGLAASNDDDAQAATPSVATITDEQAMNIREALEAKGIEPKRFCGKYRIEGVADLPATKYQEALAAIAAHGARK